METSLQRPALSTPLLACILAGLAMIAAGHVGQMKTGQHTRVTGTVGDLYLTLAEEVLGAKIGTFPTADKKLEDIV